MFYHLTRSDLAETVGMIVARALGQGWRVMLRCPDEALAHRLDEALWLPDDGFLPHARATGAASDARQPVLIGPGPAVNGARGLMLVAGAAVETSDLPGLDRVWVLFDGGDEGAVARARDQWRALTAQGLAAQYWTDEGGNWAKKTERAAGPAAS